MKTHNTNGNMDFLIYTCKSIGNEYVITGCIFDGDINVGDQVIAPYFGSKEHEYFVSKVMERRDAKGVYKDPERPKNAFFKVSIELRRIAA